jgi:hypothetical protein
MRDGVESKVPPSHNENNKYLIGFDDNPTDLEESLLRDKGTHIRYGNDILILNSMMGKSSFTAKFILLNNLMH